MVKDGIIPRVLIMALKASNRESGAGMLVVIIVLMAIDTLLIVGCGKDGCKIRRAVAGSALETVMGADEVKPA